MSEQPAINKTPSEALLNYISKGFPIAPRWSIVACVVLLALFVLIGFQAKTGASWVTDFNSFVAGTIQSWRTPALTQFMSALTLIGTEPAVVVIALVVLMWLGVRHRWDDFLYFLGNFAVFLLISQGSKFIFCTPRPTEQAIIDLPASFSYPSGHAGSMLMLALMISMLAIVYFRKHGKSDIPGFAVLAVLLVLAVLIAISRVYLGVHWGIDLVGGWCVALAWGLPTFTWFIGQYPRQRFEGGRDPYGVNEILERRNQK